MDLKTFQEEIRQGIPDELPKPRPYPVNGNPAPKRKEVLSSSENEALPINEALSINRAV